jgi:AcrR family transcriptional regulator
MATGIRKPTAERRREVVAAALRIIGSEGVTHLTTSRLAAEVGLSSGALFRHFRSLDEILLEAARTGAARLEETYPPKGLPPRERLSLLLRNRARLLGEEPGLAWLLLSEQARLILPPPAVALLASQVRRSRRYLAATLREGMAEGTLRDDIDPGELLAVVSGTLLAVVGMPGFHRQKQPGRRSGRDRVLAALDRLLASDSSSPRTREGASR